MTKKTAVLWILVLSSIGILDAVFKFLAISHLPIDTQTSIRPFFDLALHKNPGIAFDLPVPLPLVIFLTIVVLFFTARFAYISLQKKHLHHAVAATAILIGATGNLLDRLLNGFTTDYLIFFARSAMNLSDILILTGAIYLIRYSERIERKH